MARDINPSLAEDLGKFIATHHAEFYEIPRQQYRLLELAALALCAEHYARSGYAVALENLDDGYFRVKMSTRGKPWHYSWFRCESAEIAVEIHAKMSVRGAHADEGIYCVDVAVTSEGCLPGDAKARKGFSAIPNRELITFAEAKKLVAYPMLLAQFVGIVHEIKYRFLSGQRRPRGFVSQHHFNPALITIGYLQSGSRPIREGFRKRGFHVTILPDADFELSRLRQDPERPSPLLE